MAIEMSLSRLLAPFFGTSLFVWGAVIGMTLASLSVGYWVGGKLVDKNPEVWRMFAIGATASILSSVIMVLFDFVFQGVRTDQLVLDSFGFVVFLFVVSLVFFAIPIFFFSMIVPFAVRVITDDVKNAGTLAGKIFAFSTVGSICGVFIPSFITIPYVGVRETIFGFAMMGAVVSLTYFRRKWWAVALMLVPLGLFFVSQALYNPGNPEDIFVKETPYQLIKVAEAANGRKELKINAGFGVQSVYYPNEVYSDSYWDSFSVFPYMLKEKNEDFNVLVLGMAGGTIPHQMRKLVGEDYNLNFVGVDIDPELKTVAREYFNSDEEYRIGDARAYLQEDRELYDMIVVDVYGKESFIPPHLSSFEFFRELEKHITNDGVVVVNINAPSEESAFYTKFVDTFAASYPHTYRIEANELWNYLLIGGKNEATFSKVDEIENPLIEPLKKWFYTSKKLEYSDEEIFTDNLSDIEQRTMQMYFEGF